MKLEYQQTRFLVEEIDQVPDRFGVVTACNPNGMTATDEQNKTATIALRSSLAAKGYIFFTVTGCLPDLRHQEPGFGIVAQDCAEIVELGRAWRQEAVFWIERGIVHLVPCGGGQTVTLGEWRLLVQQ